MATHLPFRCWCKHCVKGKAKGLPHRKHDKLERIGEEVPLVNFDYTFMDDDQKGRRGKGYADIGGKRAQAESG